MRCNYLGAACRARRSRRAAAAATSGNGRSDAAAERRAHEGGRAAAVDSVRELAVPEVPGDVRAPANERRGGAPHVALPAALLEELSGGTLPVDARLTEARAEPKSPPPPHTRRSAQIRLPERRANASRLVHSDSRFVSHRFCRHHYSLLLTRAFVHNHCAVHTPCSFRAASDIAFSRIRALSRFKA